METKRGNMTKFEEALRRKALGYEVTEMKEIVEEDDTGKRKVKKERTTKTVPPDLEAMKLWREYEARAEGGGGVTLVSVVPRPPSGGKEENAPQKTSNRKAEAGVRAKTGGARSRGRTQ